MISDALNSTVASTSSMSPNSVTSVPLIISAISEKIMTPSLSFNISEKDYLFQSAYRKFSSGSRSKDEKSPMRNRKRNVPSRNGVDMNLDTPVANLMYNRTDNDYYDNAFKTYSYKTPSSSTTTPNSRSPYSSLTNKHQNNDMELLHLVNRTHLGHLSLSTTSEIPYLGLGSSPPEEKFPLYIRIWASVAVVIVLLVGVAGNVLVPVLVCLNKDLRHSTNLFLLNLAAADLLVLLVCLPTALVELHARPDTWVLGSAMCWLVPLVEVLVTRASVLTLVVISVERYLAICRPLRTQSLCSKPRAAVVCAALWILALGSAVPTLLATQFRQAEYHDGTLVDVCLTGLHHAWASHYYLVSAAVFVLLPFLLLLGVYTLITCRLLMQKPHSPPRYLAMQQWRAKKQVAMMLGAVVAVFFLCLLPFQVLTVWIILSTEEAVRDLSIETYYNVLYLCRLLLYINSASNPIIYNAMSSKFRNALLRLFGKGTAPPGKRSLRRTSTMTTSFSSSSFVSLRRRASQVISRTLYRKPDPNCVSSDTSRSDGRTTSSTMSAEIQRSDALSAEYQREACGLTANLSEDDLQNQNYDALDVEKSNRPSVEDSGGGNCGALRIVKCEVEKDSHERANGFKFDGNSLEEQGRLDAICCEVCNTYFASKQSVRQVCLVCVNESSFNEESVSEISPLNNLSTVNNYLEYPSEQLDVRNSPTPSTGEKSPRFVSRSNFVLSDTAPGSPLEDGGEGKPVSNSPNNRKPRERSASTCSEGAVVVQILDDPGSSPMLPRYTKPVRTPRGRKPVPQLPRPASRGKPPVNPKKPFVKKVSFRDASEDGEYFTEL